MEVIDNHHCFACGAKNPKGLKMEISFENGRAISRIVLSKTYQGWQGIAHGGIVATLLDEVMAHAVMRTHGLAVTGSLEVRFRAPVLLDVTLRAEGWVESLKSGIALGCARIVEEDTGKVLAEAKGKFILKGGA